MSRLAVTVMIEHPAGAPAPVVLGIAGAYVDEESQPVEDAPQPGIAVLLAALTLGHLDLSSRVGMFPPAERPRIVQPLPVNGRAPR